MKSRFYIKISMMLILAILAPTAMLATADAPEALEIDIDESGLVQGGEDDLLPAEGGALELDGGLGDGLISGDLLDAPPSDEGTRAEDAPQTPEGEADPKDDEDQEVSGADESTGQGDDAGSDEEEQPGDAGVELDEPGDEVDEAAPGEAVDALSGETDEAALALEPNDLSETEAVGDSEGTLESVTASGGMDNDAMFEAYMRQVLPGMAPRLRLRSAKSAGANLSGLSARLYGALLPMIREVAGGTRTSTVFELDSAAMDTENRWWTAEDLGLASLNESNVGPALLAKEGFDQTGIMQALLANCPYDLYWFDKTKHENKPYGMSWSYIRTTKTDNGVRYIRLKSMTAKMVVAKDYSRTNEIGTYEVNDLPARVSDAVTNINRIVADNSGKSDEDKLWAYANAVCGLVEYNYDALKPDTPYGDPWQLVFIFDGDDSTKVVCEGYSKGFKYLCDLSSFRGDVACELMSGSILAGAHMWNTVHMPDGRNYLVDLTNSDGGSSCDGWCYMKGCTGDPTGGYTCNGLTYKYKNEMASTFGDSWLTLSNGDYGRDYAVNVSASHGTLTADPAEADPGQTVTLTLTPESGYIPAGITVDHVSDLKQTEVGSGVWTFTMPMREVTAVATCVESQIKYTVQGYTGVYDGQPHGIDVKVDETRYPAVIAYGEAENPSGSVPLEYTDVGTKTVCFKISQNGVEVQGRATVTITPKTLGLEWDNGPFVYDGNAHTPTATLTGLVGDDVNKVTATVKGSGINAGRYMAVAELSGDDHHNYKLPMASYKEFTIGKRTVGLSWGSGAFTYDGQSHAPTATATGLISGDSCTVTVAGEQTKVGSYTATATKLSNANYALPSANTKAFTIGKRTVGLSWGNTTFTYDGQGHAPTAAATGLVSGDSCAVTVNGKQTNVGNYTATATGLSNANYALPSANTRAFTIGKRTVGLSWGASAFTYDGQGHAPTATATGLISGDSCAVTVAGKQTNVGSYTATATGLSNANYALPSANTRAFTIGRKVVGVTWGSASLTYNGQVQTPAVTVNGLAPGDSCTATVAGGQRNVGSYTAEVTGLSNANYALNRQNLKQAYTIRQKTVGLEWDGTLVYNGKVQSPRMKATGVAPGDVCTVTVKGSGKDAGSYKAEVTGISNGNYALPADTPRTFVIAPKTVGLKWSKVSVTYNRKIQKPTVTLVGVLKGDKCKVTVKGSGKNAGFYTVTATRLSNPNYTLPEVNTHVLEIKKKTVKLKWGKTRLKYNGKYQKPTATVKGLIKGDKCKVTVSGAQKQKGSYIAKATKLSNKNYQLPRKTTVKFKIY